MLCLDLPTTMLNICGPLYQTHLRNFFAYLSRLPDSTRRVTLQKHRCCEGARYECEGFFRAAVGSVCPSPEGTVSKISCFAPDVARVFPRVLLFIHSWHLSGVTLGVSAHLGVQSDIYPFRVSHWLATNNHAYCGKSSSVQEHRGPSWGPSGEHRRITLQTFENRDLLGRRLRASS